MAVDAAVAALTLASDQGFQAEIAALRAKATFTELLGAAPAFNWAFTTERAARNVTAIYDALRQVASVPEALDDAAGAALVAAQAWEGLAVLEDHASRAGALINAAVAYELAGYQANAACLARQVTNPRAWTAEPTFEGLAAAFVQRLLLRVITGSPTIDQPPAAVEDLLEDELGGRMAEAIGARGLVAASYYLLGGDDTQLQQASNLLELARRGFSSIGDVRRANLVSNLLAALPVVQRRATWSLLRGVLPENGRWQRYLRVLARGLGAQVLDSRSISELWPSQLTALSGGLLDPHANKVIRMPTSAGKTRVAELAIVHTLATIPESRCLYVAPYRALVGEVEGSFSTLFADVGYPTSAVSGSYERDILDDAILAEDRVLVLTPEKLDLVTRLQPDALEEVALVVLDEGHIVGDAGRGARYEFLVTRLRRLLPNARFLFLSAVVPQQTLVEFAEWINAGEADVVESSWRPSIQRLARLDWAPSAGTGVLRYDQAGGGEALARFLPNLIRRQRFEFRNPATNRVRREDFPEGVNKGQIAAALAWELAAQGTVLVFCAQTDWAQSVGTALGRRIQLARLTEGQVPAVFQPAQPPRSYFVAREWLGPDDMTTVLLAQRIGVHHGRQPEAVRVAIEEDFRARRLAVIAATSTLAQGVNLPVRTVIIHSVWRYDEDTGARVRLPARDYWNIAGRAGRAGEETEGTIIHIVKDALDRADYDYYRGTRDALEPIDSALFRLLRDLVQERTSEAVVASQLDAEVLALLVEEASGQLDVEELAALVNQSLVAIQARRHGFPPTRLISSVVGAAQHIFELVPDAERRAVFSATGLRTRSCLAIVEHIGANRDRLGNLLPTAAYDDTDALSELLLDGLSGVDEMQPRAAYSGSTRDLLRGWLEGRSVADELARTTPTDDVSRFIEEFFTYLLPWGTTSYLRVATHVLEIDEFSPLVVGFASLIKYGVPTLQAAWAMSAGVPDRSTAMLLANAYTSQDRPGTVADFRRWLGDLDPEELAEEFAVPEAAVSGLSRAIFRGTQNPILTRLDQGQPLFPMTARVRVSPAAAAIMGAVRPEERLGIHRDYSSPYRNATYVTAQGQRIGYMRLSDALVVGPEVDAGASLVGRLRAVEEGGGRSYLELEVHEQA